MGQVSWEVGSAETCPLEPRSRVHLQTHDGMKYIREGKFILRRLFRGSPKSTTIYVRIFPLKTLVLRYVSLFSPSYMQLFKIIYLKSDS